MSSERGGHWLAGVEAILRSKSHDLRTLADLAGLDPKTMYIGTRMDGADLRGQDLRGLTFTHLDRSKVRIDDRTRFDGEPEPPAPEAQDVAPHGDALVLLLDPEQAEGYYARADRLPFSLTIFLAHEAVAFWKACQGYAGPKLVVVAPQMALPPLEDLMEWRVDRDVIFLIGVDRRPSALLRALSEGFVSLPASMILAPLTADLGASRRARLPSLAAPLRDLLWLAVSNWFQVSRMAHEKRRMIFLSARGEAGADRDAAWYQLYGRAARLGLEPIEGARLVPMRGVGRSSPSSELLFPETHLWELWGEPGWPSFDAALLVGPQFKSTGLPEEVRPHVTCLSSGFVEQRYAETVLRLLLQLSRDMSQRLSPLDVEGMADLLLKGDAFALKIHIKRSEPPGRVTAMSTLSMPIDRVDELQVSETADPGTVLWTLYERRRLLVNLQDLRWLDAGDRTLWRLVAHQARRLARSIAGPSRALYFAALIQSAIQAGRVELPDKEAFLGQFGASRFGDAERLRVSVAGFDHKRVFFHMRLTDDSHRGKRAKLDFTLDIDADGPTVYGPLKRRSVPYLEEA